jgi:hypothetical protein
MVRGGYYLSKNHKPVFESIIRQVGRRRKKIGARLE